MNSMPFRIFLACTGAAALIIAGAFFFCGTAGCVARPNAEQQRATVVAMAQEMAQGMAAEIAATLVAEQNAATGVGTAADAFPTIAIPATTVAQMATETPTSEPSPTVTAILVQASNPTAAPTPEPTIEPTVEPTPEPTVAPTAEPTAEPTPAPTETPLPVAAANEGTITGLAIIGDSTQDEYRGNPEREGNFPLTTRNWVELLIEQRDINVGEWGDYPEPRNEGYAFNWARNGAGASQMLDTGQHTGAAAQCEQGLVSHVAIQIGVNDFHFSSMALNIYEGTMEDSALYPTLNYIAGMIATAAETVAATGKCQVLVAAMQDYITLPVVPELTDGFQDAGGRQRLHDAFAYLNSEIEKRVTQLGIPFFDYNEAYMAELAPRLDDSRLLVGNAVIDLATRGGEAHHGLLDDEYVHPGTVLSGLTANVYLAEFNRVFGTHYALLSDAEILQAAGIPQ